MNFSIDLTLGGVEYTISPAVVNVFLVCIFLSIIFIIVGIKADKHDFRKKPKGLLQVAEIYVEFVDNLTKQNMGKANFRFAPYMGALFLLLVVSNLSGLLGFTPPTSDYNVPLGLALITFFLTEYNAIKYNGIGNYLKGFFEPIVFLAPLNVLNIFANPVSLSFRLFGNIVGGSIIMGLVYMSFEGIKKFFAPILTSFLHGYFDVFAGLLQAFVFLMLTMIYIGGAIGDREEEVVEENVQ